VGSKIQLSNDTVTWTTIYTIGPDFHSGWNIYTFSTLQTASRYVRYFGNTTKGLSPCTMAEVRIKGVRYYQNDVVDATAYNCDANLTINNKVSTLSAAVKYSTTATPVVSSISPKMGPTIGGTTLTITGTSFGSVTADVQVVIDGVTCSVQSVSST